MGMNNMVQFLKQLSSRLSPNMYTSIANRTDAASVAFLRQLQRDLQREDVLDIPFAELKVVVFDLETTGFYPQKGDSILSIGAVKMIGNKVLEGETFYSLVKNEVGLSEDIVKLTGITEEQLVDAPPIEVVLKRFFQFVENETLVAHHAKHEKDFMDHVTWSILRSNFQHRILDTSFLTKIVDPGSDLVTLCDLCMRYGITIEQRHHALYDSIATAKLWAENVNAVQRLGFLNLGEVYSQLAKMR
jgi:DNA polymerase III subunit epsilon